MSASTSTARPAAIRGIGLMVAGCAFLMMSDAVSKWLSQTYPIGQIMSMRNVFVMIPILIVVWHRNSFGDLRVKSWGGQTMRAGFHVASAALFVTSITYLPLADVHAIAFAGPIFIAPMAPFLLGESVGWRRWTAILIGFAGVLVMLRPTGAGIQWIGLIPLAAAFSAALRDVATRWLSKTDTSISILFFSSIAVIIGGMTTIPWGWEPLTWTATGLFLLNGLVNGTAHFLIIESYRAAQAPVVAPFKYSMLLWATLFGFLIWGHLPDRWIIFGALAVVASGLYILHREQRAAAAAAKTS
jgi:drug/metabolite transporter (DMT)-like permease